MFIPVTLLLPMPEISCSFETLFSPYASFGGGFKSKIFYVIAGFSSISFFFFNFDAKTILLKLVE